MVRDIGARQRLSDAMIGGRNAARVLEAPATVVFAADMEPARLIPETVDMERHAGKPSRYCRALEADAGALLAGPCIYFSTPAGEPLAGMKDSTGDEKSISCHVGGRAAAAHVAATPAQLHGMVHGVRRALLASAAALLGGAAPLPHIDSAEGWAYKNAALAAQTCMLAAASTGLASHPMEGLDPRVLCRALDIPWPRYAIPLVVSLGYAANNSSRGGDAAPTSSQVGQAPPLRDAPRPPYERMFRLNTFTCAYPLSPEASQ